MNYMQPLPELWMMAWRFIYIRLRFIKRGYTAFFYKKSCLGENEANEVIYQHLIDPHAFMLARFGATELQTLRNHYFIHRSKSRLTGLLRLAIWGEAFFWRERVRRHIIRFSGVFPTTDEVLEYFCQLYLRDIAQIDLLGIWYRPHEDYLYRTICPKAHLTELKGLNPFFSSLPWTRALEGRKVLVIHPFADTIEKQYAKHKRLFSRADILPDFELQTIRAVQSLGGDSHGYVSWFEAYEAMCRQIEQCNFDIAIIGAGAYGLPLAAHIKSMGKKALHLGGVTQLLFGIKGKRWDDSSFATLYNEHWVYPSAAETPAHYRRVEGGCYWGP